MGGDPPPALPCSLLTGLLCNTVSYMTGNLPLSFSYWYIAELSEGVSVRETAIRLTCGTFLIDIGGPISTVDSTLLRQGVLGWIRKIAEQKLGIKPVSNIPLWLLLQFLFELLSWLLLMMDCDLAQLSQISPFLYSCPWSWCYNRNRKQCRVGV